MAIKGIVPSYKKKKKEWNLNHPNSFSNKLYIFHYLFQENKKNKWTDFFKQRTCSDTGLPFIHFILKSLFKTNHREGLNSTLELICSAMPGKNADWRVSLNKFPGTGALEKTEALFPSTQNGMEYICSIFYFSVLKFEKHFQWVL